MGWMAEGVGEAHEGWVAHVLADGRTAAGSSGAGVLVHGVAAEDVAARRTVVRYPYGGDVISSEATMDDVARQVPDGGSVEVIVPWDQVASWRVSCQCGWTGSERPAFQTDTLDYRDCPDDLEDSVFRPEWRAHVAPFTAASELGDLAEQLRTLEGQLADRVRLARTGGASWAQIGAAVGLTRQGAQQRWGDPVLRPVATGSRL